MSIRVQRWPSLDSHGTIALWAGRKRADRGGESQPIMNRGCFRSAGSECRSVGASRVGQLPLRSRLGPRGGFAFVATSERSPNWATVCSVTPVCRAKPSRRCNSPRTSSLLVNPISLLMRAAMERVANVFGLQVELSYELLKLVAEVIGFPLKNVFFTSVNVSLFWIQRSTAFPLLMESTILSKKVVSPPTISIRALFSASPTIRDWASAISCCAWIAAISISRSLAKPQFEFLVILADAVQQFHGVGFLFDALSFAGVLDLHHMSVSGSQLLVGHGSGLLALGFRDRFTFDHGGLGGSGLFEGFGLGDLDLDFRQSVGRRLRPASPRPASWRHACPFPPRRGELPLRPPPARPAYRPPLGGLGGLDFLDQGLPGPSFPPR
jgi:hypothetical protein